MHYMQASTGKEVAQNEDKYRVLAEHLGMKDGAAVIGYGMRGRGVFASRKLGLTGTETVFDVPLEGSVLCVPDAAPEAVAFVRKLYAQADLPVPLAAFAECTETNQVVRLAVLLQWQLRQSMQGRLYAATLPAKEEYANALLLPPEAILEFQDAKLQQKVMEVRAEAESWHMELLRSSHLQDWPHLIPELPDFLLLLTHVSTRTFVGRVGKGNVALMVPFGDLINHEFEPCCNFGLLPRKMHFEIYSRRCVSSGEELCISYGEQLTSYELQVRYGFIVPGNPNDSIDLPMNTEQQGAESSSGIGIDAKQLHQAATHLCATTYAKDSVAQRRVESAKATLKAARWLGAASPAEASAIAARAYKAHLGSFATTIEDDERLLNQGDLQGSLAAVVRFRLERKLLMRTALDLAVVTKDSYIDRVLNEE